MPTLHPQGEKTVLLLRRANKEISVQTSGKTTSAVIANQSAPQIVPKELWEREFTALHSIPSSLRDEPAKALVLFGNLLRLRERTNVLDLGCGNGRNTIYLARKGCSVTALDFADAAISQTARRARRAGLTNKISVAQRSFEEAIPYPNDSFDFVLDSYVSCHFLHKESRDRLYREIGRVVRPTGSVLSIGFSTEDEYYAQFIHDRSACPLVLDPVNGIGKRIYSEPAIKDSFAHAFSIEYFVKFEFDDVVLGDHFQRVVFCSVLKSHA